MVTITGIFRSILMDNFESHREPLEVTFSDTQEDEATAAIGDFSLRSLDGAQRAMCALGICHYLIITTGRHFKCEHMLYGASGMRG